MAWRFKASKYKNAAPIVPKPENYVRDICVGSYQTYGNNIAASAKFMAFNWDHAGSSLAVLPIDDYGRKSKMMPLLHAHSDTVTDMDFSPFHDGLLATGSQDCLVKIWHIPESGLQESLSNAECTFSHKQRRVEKVGFHPSADFLLHSISYMTLTLWDLISQQEIFSNGDHRDVIQSTSWKRDGSLLATSCKDKQVRVIDPRVEDSCIKIANSHQSIKDSRIVWLGEQNKILTTGFDAARLRQVIVRDMRNFSEPEKTLELDCSTGILIPLYDADTGMLFLAGKGDTTISYMEVSDKEPYLIEGLKHTGEQTKGACLVPKRALNVMQGEVNRILQLTSGSVIPITYQVPRKTYRDFHADLYPDTAGYTTELTAASWFQGKNIPVPKMSLDPAKRLKGEAPITPRLGPKPFTPPKLNETESFDKVFSVPPVPCNKTQNGLHENKEIILEEKLQEKPILKKEPLMKIEPPTIKAESIIEADPKVLKELHAKEVVHVKDDTANGIKEDYSFEESDGCPSTAERRRLFEAEEVKVEETEDDSNYKPRTPSTAERRKMFETKDDEEEVGNFERNAQRASIAERRKMYESKNESPETEKSPVMLRRKGSFKNKDDEEENRKNVFMRQQSLDPQIGRKNELTSSTPKRTSTVFGRVSKFRHLKGTPAHKSLHIENIRNISRQIPGECDGFHANPERVAVPLSGPGGKIAIFELSKKGKLPDGVIPALVHGSNIMDFCWDPFDNHRLAVACDDGIIRLWRIPQNGLTEPTNVPEKEFSAHSDKIYFVKFHPNAKDVLASGSYDTTVRIWDLTMVTEKIVLSGHAEQIFNFAWSPYGIYCATISKDSKIRVYNPRSNTAPIREGKGPVGSRGARIVWSLDGTFIAVTGFDKVSERQIMVFKAKDLSVPLNTVGLDVSPAILIPFYDEDSSTLFLTGKGDSTIYAFEITEEAPYICPLSHHRCGSLHQGLSFLPKNACDVTNVEFAKALRLTNNTIEPLSFTVPRIKTEFFQDDLFPPTKVTWKPALSSAEWFSGKNTVPIKISLKPEGMSLLSDSQPPEMKLNKSVSQTFTAPSSVVSRLGWGADITGQIKSKQDEIQKSVSSRLEVNMKLEQDEMEGVDENEWEDE